MLDARRRLPTWGAAVAVVLPLVAYGLTKPRGDRLIDLAVYRQAAQTVRAGEPLYGFATDHGLPFTYPPAAALLGQPLGLLGADADGLLWLLGVLAALAFSLRRLAAAAGLAWWWAPVLLVAVAWTEPLRDVFRFGQVGVLLLALCVADLSRIGDRPARLPRGVLIGLAGAVKLTPLVFLPVLWLAGRRREALTAAATAGGITLAAAALLPRDSWQFWTSALWDVGRLGAEGGSLNPGNQSVRGMVLRAGLPEPLWLLLAGALLGIGLPRAARALREGDPVACLAIGGCLSVAVSPVAWIHHLVWLAPVAVVLIRDARWLALAVVLAVSVPRSPWLAADLLRAGTPGRPLWLLWQDAQGLAAVGVVLAARRVCRMHHKVCSLPAWLFWSRSGTSPTRPTARSRPERRRAVNRSTAICSPSSARR